MEGLVDDFMRKVFYLTIFTMRRLEEQAYDKWRKRVENLFVKSVLPVWLSNTHKKIRLEGVAKN